jgi:hypothetical protein
MENSKANMPIKVAAAANNTISSFSSPENPYQVERKAKRAKLSSSDNSLDYSDSLSLSSSSTSVNPIVAHQGHRLDSENVNVSPPLPSSSNYPFYNSYSNNVNQSEMNYPNLYQQTSRQTSAPYYYSAYDQFFANQIYSRNLLENFNYNMTNQNAYQANASAPFVFGNQFNYKYNSQYYPCGNSYFAN